MSGLLKTGRMKLNANTRRFSQAITFAFDELFTSSDLDIVDGKVVINLADPSGLERATDGLAIDPYSIGGMKIDSNGLSIKLPSPSGMITDVTGLYVDAFATGGLQIDANGTSILLPSVSGLQTDATGLWQKLDTPAHGKHLSLAAGGLSVDDDYVFNTGDTMAGNYTVTGTLTVDDDFTVNGTTAGWDFLVDTTNDDVTIGTSTDNVTFNTAGQPTFNGTSTYTHHKEMEISGVSFGPGNSPASTKYQGFDMLRFDRATEEEIFLTVEIPAKYKDAGTIRIDVDFFVENPPVATGDEVVVWGVEYKAFSHGDVFDFSSGTATATDTVTITDGESARVIHDAQINLTTTGFAAEDHLMLRIYRDATNPNDTYDNEAVGADNDAWVFDLEAHFECNTLGEY
jgi:hypothetical protein